MQYSLPLQLSLKLLPSVSIHLLLKLVLQIPFKPAPYKLPLRNPKLLLSNSELKKQFNSRMSLTIMRVKLVIPKDPI